MSSTGMGPRLGGPDDVYQTPSWCVARLLEAWHPPAGTLLEPGAGSGAIIRAAQRTLTNPWLAVECRATVEKDLVATGAAVKIADFLTWEPGPSLDISAALCNPPFHSAEEFIRRAATVFQDADLVFLVRLGFLAGAERTKLWLEVGAPDVYVLPNRPSFTPDGKTDSADYAWIVLPGDEVRSAGKFRVLATTPLDERKAARS